MKSERIVLITVIIGLFTGVLALLSGYYSLQKEIVDLEIRNRESDQRAKDAEAETTEFRKRLDDQAKNEEKQRLCASHSTKADAIEGRFSSLMSDYGTALRFLKNCANGATGGVAAGCVAAACVGATNSLSECMDVGNTLGKIMTDYDTEKRLAAADTCPLPQSAIDDYRKN